MKSYLYFIISEGLQSFKKCGRAGFLSIGIMTMTLFVYGIFLFFTSNVNMLLDELKETRRVIVYVKKGLPDDKFSYLVEQLRGLENIENFETITEEAALSRFRNQFSEGSALVSALDENPLPASIEFTVSKEVSDIEQIINRIHTLDGIEEIHYGRKTARRIKEIGKIVNGIALIFSSVLFIISLFIITNTIQLTVYMQREEIHIMQLVGSTDGMIRWPFVIVGFMQGTLSALITIAMLYVLYYYVVIKTAIFSFLPLRFLFLSFNEIMYIIVFASVMGVLGSILAVSRYLRTAK